MQTCTFLPAARISRLRSRHALEKSRSLVRSIRRTTYPELSGQRGLRRSALCSATKAVKEHRGEPEKNPPPEIRRECVQTGLSPAGTKCTRTNGTSRGSRGRAPRGAVAPIYGRRDDTGDRGCSGAGADVDSPQAAGGVASAARSQAARVLSFGEREEISRVPAAGNSFRAIAKTLSNSRLLDVNRATAEAFRTSSHGPQRSAARPESPRCR